MKIKNIYEFHCLLASILYGDKYLKPPEFHREVLDIYNNDDRQQLVVAPAGFAKSLTVKTFLVKELFEGKKVQLYVCSTRTLAKYQFTAITKIFKNQILKQVFGYEVTKSNEDEIYLTFKNGDERLIIATSAEAQILGMNVGANRPYNIVIDDLESQEQVSSFYRTKKLKEWIDVSLASRLPSLVEGKMRWIGTNLGQNSLVNQVLTGQIQDWKFYKYRALDKNNKSIWEEKEPTEALLEKKRSNPFAFATNYMNEPPSNMTSLFQESDIGYYEYVNRDDIDEFFAHYDTTHTAKTTSDYFCYTLAGKNKKDSKIYLLDFILSKEYTPQQQRQLIISNFRKYPKLKRATFDKVSNDAFEQDVINEARKEDIYLHPPLFEGVKFGSDKFTHILRHEHIIKSKAFLLPSRHPQIQEAVFQLTNFSLENVKSNNSINDDFVDGISGVLDNFLVKKIEVDFDKFVLRKI